jgi:hypothetical protein
MESQCSTPGARPPVVEFFLGRIFVWAVLVCACAAPIVVMTWRDFTPLGRLGEALGVFVWIVAISIFGEQLRWPRHTRTLGEALMAVMWHRWTSRDAHRTSGTLRWGALSVTAIHTALAVFAGPLGVFLWFAPAVYAVTVVSYVPLMPESESDFWNCLMWTLVCGAQSAVVAWLCGRAIDRARRALGRR